MFLTSRNTELSGQASKQQRNLNTSEESSTRFHPEKRFIHQDWRVSTPADEGSWWGLVWTRSPTKKVTETSVTTILSCLISLKEVAEAVGSTFFLLLSLKDSKAHPRLNYFTPPPHTHPHLSTSFHVSAVMLQRTHPSTAWSLSHFDPEKFSRAAPSRQSSGERQDLALDRSRVHHIWHVITSL